MSRSSALEAAALAAHDGWPPGWVGTVQPHGMLLVLRGPQLRIVQASTSAAALLQRPLDTLLLATLHELGGDVEARLKALLDAGPLLEPQALHCWVGDASNASRFEGSAHRTADGSVVLELEPATRAEGTDTDLIQPELLHQLSLAVQSFSTAATLPALAACAAERLQWLTGYDRVWVSELGGHGATVLHETHQPGVAPAAGSAEPWVQPSARAQAVYLAKRVRVVVDATAAPSELLPQLPPGSGGEVDLQRSELRSTSEEHALRLRQHGVAASMVVALVRHGQLWGLFTCHHQRPRRPSPALRAAAELLAEAFMTRVTAIENHDRRQFGNEMQQLAQRLLEAVSRHGDWRSTLLRDETTLLQPLRACGALLWHEGVLLRCGRGPHGAALQALLGWLETHPARLGEAACAPGFTPPRGEPAYDALAVSLSTSGNDALVWLRETGSAERPAPAWSRRDQNTAAAFCRALIDVELQVNTVRLLIAESQLARVRAAVANAHAAVLLLDAGHRALHANAAFRALSGRPADALPGRDALAALFTEPERARQAIGQVCAEQRAWQGELALQRPDGSAVPVAMRAEPVPAGDHGILGTVFTLHDLRDVKHTDEVRRRLEATLTHTGRSAAPHDRCTLVGALVANAGLAAMDIVESGAGAAAAAMLEDVEASTARATALLQRIHATGGGMAT